MSVEKKTEWVLDQKFDRRSCRHLTNGAVTVLHCHHYATLYCQLADDAEMVDGKELLRKSSAEVFWPVLRDYFEAHGITDLSERVALVEDYWKACGMGLLCIERIGQTSAAARMDHSHVDEGWLKKWGARQKPVNFIGQGYLKAAVAAINGLSPDRYVVEETASLVAGAPASRFNIVLA